ncbi:Hsp70 family protein [Actinoplanes sp. NBC_00393]|uniref:Hsp70 family protein n=1 Tax=Actinoplanes sp. NBC_00393 TaxID=2975953 RepID=UPI002E1DE7CA
MDFHRVIGIDLGTTYSAVSVWDGRETTIIPNRQGYATVPSVVGVDRSDQVIVGMPAQNSMVLNPQNTVIEVKRLMGTFERQPTGTEDPGVPQRIRFRGQEYLPQEISAFILMELKRQAEEHVGEAIHDAVITVPAYFREPQRRATEEAARMARLNVRMLVNEPTAAAVCFGADKAEGDRTVTYVVYDLGGGTFDVSVIQVHGRNVSVVGTGGDSHLGGGDFDDRIVTYALEQIRQEFGVDLSGDPKVRRRIKREAELRKRELSSASMTTLDLPYLTAEVSANIPLSRVTFESLIADLLERSLTCLDEAIESARQSNGIEPEMIEQVLLVGGSTRIACIRPMLAERLGLELRDVRIDLNPDEVVARGAGMLAREYAPADAYLGEDVVIRPAGGESAMVEPDAIVLQDVTSHSLGVRTLHDRFSIILPKDSRIPGEAAQHYTNADDNVTELPIQVFQGEHESAIDNQFVGSVPIAFPEPRPRGYWDLEVTFALDIDGLLHVKVHCVNNGTVREADLRCSVHTSREGIEQSSAKLHAEMAGMPKPPAEEPPAPTIPPLPEKTPPEYALIAGRSRQELDRLAGESRERLLAAYTAFVDAVHQGTPERIAECGDTLFETYTEARSR